MTETQEPSVGEQFVYGISDQTTKIIQEAHWLIDLSEAFGATGNEKLSKELMECGRELIESCNEIQQWVGRETADVLHKSFESSKNMLMASLAGAAIASEDSEEIEALRNLSGGI